MNLNKRSFNKLFYIKKQIRDLVTGDIVLHPIYRTDGLMLVNEYKPLSSSLISMVQKHIMASKEVLVAASKEELSNFITFNNSQTPEFIQDLKRVAAEINTGMVAQTNSLNPITAEASSDLCSIDSSVVEQVHEYNSFAKMLSDYPLWVEMDSKLESEILKLRAQQVKKELLTTMGCNKTFVELFNKIREYDDVLLIHSINTMCLYLMLGLTLELNRGDLFDLAVAALFSNLGFIQISKSDFQNFLRTNEHVTAELKRHLEAFSEMTENFPMLRKKSIVFGILDHHEYYNGKGYPNNKAGEEISLYGRILSIAHNYDELAGGYNYQIGLHPMDALRIIYENQSNKYDQRILNIFINRTTYFKLGQVISLPNIQNGVIIGFDDFIKKPHLPIVKLESGQVINLATR